MAKKTVADLRIQVGAGTATLERDFNSAAKATKRFGRNVEMTGAALPGVASRIRALSGTIATFLGITGGLGGLGFAARFAADMEQVGVAFKTIAGDANLAKQAIADIQEIAANTPFQLPELLNAGRSLLAFGENATTVAETLRRIGDVSAGVGARIGDIAEIYGKARVQGRLFAEDINQLTGRGIPIIGELARQFGVTEQAVKDLVKEGKVNFANLEEAFRSLTSEGGTFFGLMQAQSETLSGRISTLKDNVGLLFLEIGNKLLPVLKAAADFAISAANAIRNLDGSTVRAIATTVTFVGTLVLLNNVIPKLITGLKALRQAIRAVAAAATAAQSATGIGGLVKAVAFLGIALGASFAVDQLFAGMDEQADKAAESIGKVAKNIGDLKLEVPPVMELPEALKETSKRSKELENRIRKLRSELSSLQGSGSRESSTAALVRGSTEGFRAVLSGQSGIQKLIDTAKRQEEILAEIRVLTEEIRDKEGTELVSVERI